MGCKSDAREIDGHKYTVTQMPATQSIPIQVELATTLADVAVPLMQASNGKQEAIAQAIVAVADGVRRNLPPERFMQLVTTLLTSDLVRRDGERVNLDLHFSGDDAMTLYKVLAFVLEVNYAGFFQELNLAEFIAKTESKVPPYSET